MILRLKHRIKFQIKDYLLKIELQLHEGPRVSTALRIHFQVEFRKTTK
jgi:hypothetical protein